MKGAKNPERESECSYEENTYANMGDFHLKRVKNAPKAEEIPAAKNTQPRVILILGVLLILAFITLVILTTFLFISYKSVGEEMSQMRNGSLSSEVQSIRGAVRNLEQVQTTSNSDVKRNLTNEITGSSDPLCSEGWINYGLSCYYLSSNGKTWNASKKDCEDRQAHLVVINGKEEMDFLRRIANQHYLWIGLTDADGTWRWVDGTPYDVTPKFWENNQPDDWMGHGLGGGEDCAQLKDGVKWNDLHCSKTLRYICEKKMIF
ncbi:C-type lectin domain family 10 member A-like isoform X2 [Rana temporaria]|uniref:C-type lectin domain family 10 member A-like isoform X2 n=1 Tax=Rana temporaria TaxID=8407 RepID=UPI001AAD58B4|nr:C-type lectin domain family 10 member A-like isoform X2 [Rana temporaria]